MKYKQHKKRGKKNKQDTPFQETSQRHSYLKEKYDYYGEEPLYLQKLNKKIVGDTLRKTIIKNNIKLKIPKQN